MKSVFISSTSNDLQVHRAAVDAAIRRLELRPINMVDFGSQPGGASGTSLREVRKSDIFVGIVAHRYGYVPDPAGDGRSVTEQEYDEAVQRNIPRLMYLVDPAFDWDAALIEPDDPARGYSAPEKLTAFKAKIETNDVRSLFTTPDQLAGQVTADLVKLLDQQRRQQLIVRVLTAVVIMVVVLVAAFLAIPEFKDAVVETIGIASPTATPTATYTPTATITPTFTPSLTPPPTATPLEGTPFADGEVGVVLASFRRADADALNTEEGIIRELEAAGVPLVRVNYALTGSEQEQRQRARQIAETYAAKIVVWGVVQVGGVVINFEINASPEQVTSAIDGMVVSASELENFSAYIFEGMDVLYVINFIRGQIAYFQNDNTSAETYFDNAVAAIPVGREDEVRAAALYVYRGNARYELGQYEAALADHAAALALDPNSSLAHNSRGAAYYQLGEYERAITAYNAALALNPDYAAAYNNRGAAYNQLGEYQQAVASYDAALASNPDYAAAYNNRGNTYRELGEYQQAIADYNAALAIDPDFVIAFINRGDTFNQLGEYEQAISNYNAALELDAQFVGAYYNRGLARYYLGEYERAIADFSAALDHDPELAVAHLNRGLVYQTLGQYEQAIADYNAALELEPNFVIAYNNRGNAYLQLGEYEQARDDFSAALELVPDFPNAYFNRGITHFYLENTAAMIADWRRAEALGITLPPDILDVLEEAEAGLTPTPTSPT